MRLRFCRVMYDSLSTGGGDGLLVLRLKDAIRHGRAPKMTIYLAAAVRDRSTGSVIIGCRPKEGLGGRKAIDTQG